MRWPARTELRNRRSTASGRSGFSTDDPIPAPVSSPGPVGARHSLPIIRFANPASSAPSVFVERSTMALAGARRVFAVLDTPEERATAYNIASQSIVMLKNNGILPFNKPYKIALSGPNANHYWSMLGDYTYQSMSYFWRHNLPDPSNPKIVCLKEALENKMPQGSSLTYHRGCDWTEEIETVIERAGDSRAYTMLLDYIHKVDAGEEADAVAALNAARERDVIIAAVGENVMLNGVYKIAGNIYKYSVVDVLTFLYPI